MRIIMRINLWAAMPAPETNTRKIISRLERVAATTSSSMTLALA